MRKTWKSAEDAAKDISLIYGPCTAGDLLQGSEESKKEKKTKTNPQTYLDPVTVGIVVAPVSEEYCNKEVIILFQGEEIDISGQCISTSFDTKRKRSGLGRAQLIAEIVEERRLKTLKEQLRMNRPLGLGNEMIESYFKNYEEDEDKKHSSSSRSSWRGESSRAWSTRPEESLRATSLIEPLGSSSSSSSPPQIEEPTTTTQETVKHQWWEREKGAQNAVTSSILKNS